MYVKYSLAVSECFPTSTPSWTWTLPSHGLQKGNSTPSWTWTLWYHGPWSTKIGFYSILNLNTAVLWFMVHKKGHLLYSELQHYGTMINGPCKGASTPCWTWTLQYHSPPSPPKGFFFLHPEHEHHSTVVHSPWKRAFILSRTQWMMSAYGQTHWRATTAWEVWTWAHQLQSKAIENCQILKQRERSSAATH